MWRRALICTPLVLLAGAVVASGEDNPPFIELTDLPDHLLADAPQLDLSWLEDEEHRFQLDPKNQFDPSLGYFVPENHEAFSRIGETQGSEDGQGPADTCSAEGPSDFTVIIEEKGTLGVSLSGESVITGFHRNEDGKKYPLEASGIVQLGDRIVGVNGNDLRGLYLSDVIQALKTAEAPITLALHPGDGRCVGLQTVLPAGKDEANSSASQTKLLLFRGIIYAETIPVIPAAYSATTACAAAPLFISTRSNGCVGLPIDVNGKFVAVWRSGCDVYTKATNAQSLGAAGLLVVSEEKWEAVELQLPPTTDKNEVNIPVLMASYSSGNPLMTSVPMDMAVKVAPYHGACEKPMGGQGPELPDMSQSGSMVTEAAKLTDGNLPIDGYGGLMSVSGINQQFEFLKLAGSGGPLARTDLYSITVRSSLCSDDSMQHAKPGSAVFAREGGCTLKQKISVAAKGGAALLAVSAADHGMPSIPWEESEGSSVPVLLTTANAFEKITNYIEVERPEHEPHLNITFAGHIASSWAELTSLSNVEQWPTSSSDRLRLYNRLYLAHSPEQSTGSDERLEYLRHIYQKLPT